ncbi:hypothetical protein APHAL10511_001070 [Amanita phalloides]|nr:hypothetical protein APHAL10511_001070 [Amanita phalloides]
MLRSPLDTKPGDWKYVSEGGATAVFSYIGPADPPFDGTVLRLRKAPRVAADHDDPVIYQERCTSRLISPVHLPRLESVLLDKEWVQRLIILHDGLRPVARRSKDGIDATHGRGVLATDLVGGDWIAVEIKPKWGFLPSGEYLSPETRPVKTKTCRYCMHSYLRAAKGEIQATNYCPLDLFSGEEKRVVQAISSLWDAWKLNDGEINNLKVFVRGSFIKPSEAPSMFADGVVQSIDVKEEFISALLTPLLETTVLKRISYLQRKLDPFDIEGLSKLWRSTAEEGTSSLFTEPTMDEWEEFVTIFLNSGTINSKPSPSHLRQDRTVAKRNLIEYASSTWIARAYYGWRSGSRWTDKLCKDFWSLDM